MRATDTNLVIRFLLGDHAVQSPRAREIVMGSDVLVPLTVVLEVEWVLRSVYGFPPATVVSAFRALIGLPTVTVEHPDRLASALDRAEAGMDFADALHLASADGCDALLTFDRDFVRRAARSPGPTPVLAADP